MSDEDFDEEDTEEAQALRIARHAANTPADDRLLAMRVLRAIVDNPGVKPTDRAAAADKLLKAVNEAAGQVDDAVLQAYDLTDEQLLDVIRQAQTQRSVVSKGELLPPHPASSPLVATSGSVPAGTIDVPRGTSLLEALAGVPDLPVDVLCT